jgi:hypothetical protein
MKNHKPKGIIVIDDIHDSLSCNERAKMKKKVSAWYKETIKKRKANPPPRYDEIYFDGREWLDSL